MAHDGMKRAKGDRTTIDLTDPAEIREWSELLGVTELEVQASVEKVGPVVEDVRRYLAKE